MDRRASPAPKGGACVEELPLEEFPLDELPREEAWPLLLLLLLVLLPPFRVGG